MKYIIFSVLVCTSTLLFGQIENIQTEDSSLVINNVYAGMLSSTAFDVKTAQTTPSVNFRVGANATWRLTKVLNIKTLAMLETDLEHTSGLQLFFVNLSPSTHWTISAGKMATISTEQRALPVTSGGQFETWTQAMIPGSAPGVKVHFMPNENLSFGVGIAKRGSSTEYHVGMTHQKVALSGYYRAKEKQSGFALSFDGARVYNMFVYIPDSLLSTTLVYNFPKAVSCFSDIGYSTSRQTVPRAEVGVFKSFTSKWIKGLVSVSYDFKLKSVVGYLFIHL